MALLVVAVFAVSSLQLVLPFPLGGTHLILDSIAVLLLLHAVARHRILDIDLKLRWTVRQSTVAAAFVAVFFVVSEGAAAFLGERTGSTAFGIGAAALLVFAVSPLQRMAERLSERAVPVKGSTEAYLTYRRMELYRVALEGMLRDDVLAPREAQALQGLRSELGISLEEHDLIEHEIRARLRREGGLAPGPRAA